MLFGELMAGEFTRLTKSTKRSRKFRQAPGLRVSVITRGEHVERTGMVVTDQLKLLDAPAGITGSNPTHRFRASGWTRHYETFSEILQILAQLALGLGLANLKEPWSQSSF